MDRDRDPLPAPELDRLVAETPGIDPFCSASDWVLPAHSTWGQGKTSFISSGRAALAVAEFRNAQGARIMTGLDPLWGFACATVGAEPAEVAELTESALSGSALAGSAVTAARRRWDAALLSGLVGDSALDRALRAALGPRFDLREGPSMTRRLATLDSDWEGYLQRRSAHFRRNLRQAERRAAAAGVEFEVVIAGGAAVIDRAVAVERNSWKGQQGSGLSEARFASFYTRIAERVTPATRFRAIFARLADVDVAFILGAVRGDRYRGFQLSYRDDLAAMSLGHLLQARQLQLLAQEGIGVYDLGMDMPYKLAWSDDALTTYTLVVLAR